MTEASDSLQRIVERDRDHECPGYGASKICVRIIAVADLPTRFGKFRIVAFWNNRDAKEHVPHSRTSRMKALLKLSTSRTGG